ncbi:hypothetical protein CYMTET_50101 [Cymbomonas tetramitiformis]|uniref:Uncharacterized protein n=1 Tax=Cymbomonas tetramitiformis TaxID=36881 RepID=A0AAE0EU16_9CHLO|nr:hypothetical protein CYMTET_50101 [Cymbomonas tetramitiformis]
MPQPPAVHPPQFQSGRHQEGSEELPFNSVFGQRLQTLRIPKTTVKETNARVRVTYGYGAVEAWWAHNLREQGGTPSNSPSDSQSTPASSRRPRRIVGTSSLRSKPTSTVNAPTAFDYFNDPDVLTTTPVEEGREDEYIEQLAYAFQYGSDLLSFLKSTGLKMPTGYTLDTTTADMDFNALLSGLAHVLYPVSYSEAAKLLDLEHDHDFYHVTINEILFSILPHPLRGNA